MRKMFLRSALLAVGFALLVGCGGGSVGDIDAISENDKVLITDTNSNDVSKFFSVAVVLSSTFLTTIPQGVNVELPSFREISAAGGLGCESGSGTGVASGDTITYNFDNCRFGSTVYNGEVIIVNLVDGRSFENNNFSVTEDSGVEYSAKSFKGKITSSLVSLEFIDGYITFTDGKKFNFKDYKYSKKQLPSGENEFDISGYVSKEDYLSSKWVELKTIIKGIGDGSGNCSQGTYDVVGKDGSKVTIDIDTNILYVVYNGLVVDTYNPCMDFFVP